MAEEDDIAAVEREVEATRGRYANLSERYEQLVTAYAGASPELADDILSHADEFGREDAIDVLRSRPERFGLPADSLMAAEDAQKLGTALDRLIETSDHLDRMTARREALLSGREPGRAPILVMRGQEYSAHLSTHTLQPTQGRAVPMDIVEVWPKRVSAPDRVPEMGPVERAPVRPQPRGRGRGQ